MFGMLGVAWNIMGGYAGMFSFGQAAFFGIGAYTSSYLSTAHGVNPWIGLVAGGCAAALVAAAIGYPCSNLRGHYFAIASIAFAEIVRIVFNNWKMVGAAEGLTLSMQNESFANFLFNSSKLPYYYIMLAFLLISLAVCYFVATSKMGYYFRAIKESHTNRGSHGCQCRSVPSHGDHDQRLPERHGRHILRAIYSLHRSRERHASRYIRPDRSHLDARRGGEHHGAGDRRGYTDTCIGIHACHPRLQGNRRGHADLRVIDHAHFHVLPRWGLEAFIQDRRENEEIR